MGLDIGTGSVGWAITDLSYRQMKLNGKALWGVRLFEKGKTAEERRNARCARRRIERRKQRIRLLQELFATEINKVDPDFFMRLADSRFWVEDKLLHQSNTLFDDELFKDKDYHNDFPTIYHLRKALIEEDKAFDIRFVYLAIHHILKHRGHFLFEGQNMEHIESFENAYFQFASILKEELDIDFPESSLSEVEDILKDRKQGIKNKKKQLNILLDATTKPKKAIVTLLCGGSEKLSAVFDDDSYDEESIKKVTFKGDDFDKNVSDLEDMLGDRMVVLYAIKSIYDWSILADILNGYPFLSWSKVSLYEKHKSDLILLKSFVRENCPERYNAIFRDPSVKGNYCSYVGTTNQNGRKVSVKEKCTAEDFLKYLQKELKGLENRENGDVIFLEIQNGTFLPKQVVGENGVIPYQMHLAELDEILKNAARHHDFLNRKDDSGFSVAEKIRSILTFRIPYYVGPLNDAHKSEQLERSHCWIQRKEPGRILPWNFEEKVDIKASAELFIKRMTNYCTYLPNEKVLPKNSLLYSEFMVWNELNNLRINGEGIDVKIKTKIFEELFCQRKKVTLKQTRSFLEKEGIIDASDEITGIDVDFKSNLGSYYDFKNIIGEKIKNRDMVENIIQWIVLFGEDKKLLVSRIKENYSALLTNKEIERISTLKYSGWGRLSRAFLTEIVHVDKETGECFNIIHALRNTNCNLMQLLGHGFDFADRIREYNQDEVDYNGKIEYRFVDELYVSPAIKRGIWQTLSIVDELVKIMGHAPKKIFVEVTRGDGEKKRTESRKSFLLSCYKDCKKEERDWYKEISEKEEHEFRKNLLYLYYTQRGRCMYSGEPIDLYELLHGKNVYDIDHIYPQSKIKDDSILNNRVLVKNTINSAVKKDIYPLPREIQEKQHGFWSVLKAQGLITREKYDRLIRTTPFTEEEQANFIARQIVETGQSVKAVAGLLRKIYPESAVVYSKAGNVSDFRRKFELVKVRSVNDYHHAKDAYLNIVVGNVYDTKFTSDPRHIFGSNGSYSLKKLYERDVERNGLVAWKANETIATVKKVMAKNNILFTRYATEEHGLIADMKPMKKGQGQLPLKSSDSRLSDIEKYGGYNKVKGAYFILVEHKKKKKLVRSLEFVPVYLAKAIEQKHELLMTYCVRDLHLEDPRILISKIKINTLFNVDGFLMHLSGRSDNRVIFKGANQLCIGLKNEEYVHKIEKYLHRCKECKKELPITVWDGITKEDNILLYDLLVDKLKNTLYNVRLSTQAKTLEEKREKFLLLPEEKQAAALDEILKMFQCNSVKSNLTVLGGKETGNIRIMKTITNYDKVSIIHQSPTGVFSQEVDLLTL